MIAQQIICLILATIVFALFKDDILELVYEAMQNETTRTIILITIVCIFIYMLICKIKDDMEWKAYRESFRKHKQEFRQACSYLEDMQCEHCGSKNFTVSDGSLTIVCRDCGRSVWYKDTLKDREESYIG